MEYSVYALARYGEFHLYLSIIYAYFDVETPVSTTAHTLVKLQRHPDPRYNDHFNGSAPDMGAYEFWT
jgi:hypothetical protein